MSITKKPWFISKEKTGTSSNFWKSRQSGYTASNYWLKDSLFERRESMFAQDEAIGESKTYDYYQLAQYQRAISNFVRIMTGRSDIIVEYSTGNKNYTDGKTVTISPNIKEKEFDVAVGLALHESSHIVYTDFIKWQEYIHKAKVLGDGHAETKKLLLNLVEDLHIDAMTYKSAPGYRGYYAALYQKYFGDGKVVDGLWSKDYALPTWDNYLFHLVNIRNPKRNLKALPGLQKMFNMLSLPTITRLSTMEDRMSLALELFAEIQKWVDVNDKLTASFVPNDGEEMSDDEMLQKLNELLESMGDGEGGEGGGDEDGGNSQGNVHTSSIPMPAGASADDLQTNALDLDKLSPKAKEALQKLFNKQKDAINGNLRKGKVSKEVQSKITAMAAADIDRTVVGAGYAKENSYGTKGVTLNIIRRLTEDFIDKFGQEYGLISKERTINSWNNQHHSWYSSAQKRVDEAIQRGKLLAKKMQIRNEERILKTSRLDSGKIDKRLLHQIGMGDLDIFEKINITSYKPSYIHLSIDASASMVGPLFDSSVQLAAMFATASKYIQNIHLQVSVRSANSQDRQEAPYIAYIFDSKKDSIQTIRSIFPRLRTAGTTPEGLVFEGIVKEMIGHSRNADAYFINICDGEPWMSFGSRNYGGAQAQKHTKQQMQKMEGAGIKFIAYFIGGEHDFKPVKNCYGNNAHRLSSANEINAIAKAMRSKLMEL